jgi:two-component system catabolic regulation response regulator CreB
MRSGKIRAIVIDDEPIIASTLAAILCLNGYSARAFRDPVAALACVLAEPPDLVICDIVMPILSGVELAREILDLCPRCKVLLFSGWDDALELLQEGWRADANLHIVRKPMNPFTLLAIIEQRLAEGAGWGGAG